MKHGRIIGRDLIATSDDILHLLMKSYMRPSDRENIWKQYKAVFGSYGITLNTQKGRVLV